MKKITNNFRLAELTVHEQNSIEIFSPCVKVAEDRSVLHVAIGVGGILYLQ